MSNVTSTPSLSRRHVLIGAAALALLSTTSVACGSKTPPADLSSLVTQIDLARADSQLAADAAAAAPPPIAAALTVVAAERTAHAEALTEEIIRVTGQEPTSSSASATSTSPPPTPGEPVVAPTPQDVVVALAKSAGSAAQAAAEQAGYRAGLLGSITAACTAAYTVALAEVAP
ncbi:MULTISPECIES: hypothetical protein [unclassified Mycolicibacterium]|uniref:hypothetical protein n=1 Tax=Mycolicibacterium sp. 624 TaxID=3156314 RepID=UPI001F4BF167|nr:hypothetical protein [Mycolicibacterium sp. YH-1]UNB50321.1 hypothetical protein L0M16_20310 [Mycolicibacterium sp. YH-1]